MDIHTYIHINSIVVFVLICKKYILAVIIDVFCNKRFRSSLGFFVCQITLKFVFCLFCALCFTMKGKQHAISLTLMKTTKIIENHQCHDLAYYVSVLHLIK